MIAFQPPSVLLLAASAIGLASAPPLLAQTSLVSATPQGAAGSTTSFDGVVSGDGSTAAFWSNSADFVPGDNNLRDDVFVRDLASGVIERASVSASGIEGNGASSSPSLSRDGRFVAFASKSTNLGQVASPFYENIYLRDRTAGTVELISRSSGGLPADAVCTRSAVSADGRLVAFLSRASNLVAGDTNGAFDVFLRDRQLGTTERVSVGSSGQQAAGSSSDLSMTPDGRFIAFTSDARNLVPGDVNAVPDVFVRDTLLGRTFLVSVASDGSQGNGVSFAADLTPDGRFVAFSSQASNLVPGDTNGVSDIFVHDRRTGLTTRVNLALGGPQANGLSIGARLSADGRFVAFSSQASNLVPGDTNGWMDVFLVHRATGATKLISQSSAGVQGDSSSSGASLTEVADLVVFHSFAGNLVPTDGNGTGDVFARVP